MIIVLKPDTTEKQREHVLDYIKDFGLKAHVSEGAYRTVIGLIGDESVLQSVPLEALPGVESVMPILKPFKLASREFHAEDKIVFARGVPIGGPHVAIMAGPCAVETREYLDVIARAVKAAGAAILRGGAFKPRSSPYSFQGLGEEGLKMLRETGDALDMPVVTEVMDTRQVDTVARYADILQVGARNMQNFDLLREVGKAGKPVLLKRGLSATIEEFLLSAEYILSEGNPNVILCERGIRTFENSTRNTFDVSAVPNIQSECHLPVVVDPSHAAGRRDLVVPLARAGIAAGAAGVLVDVHCEPEKAKCDGPQALLPPAFADMVRELGLIANVVGRSIVRGPVQDSKSRSVPKHPTRAPKPAE
ncbi:MAG: 3-deoxy-7-phosphoheptulonate synthase [Planctomycetota bacterium]